MSKAHNDRHLERPYTIRMSDDLRERLERAAIEERRSVSNLIRMILEDWLEDEAEPPNRHQSATMGGR